MPRGSGQEAISGSGVAIPGPGKLYLALFVQIGFDLRFSEIFRWRLSDPHIDGLRHYDPPLGAVVYFLKKKAGIASDSLFIHYCAERYKPPRK